MSWGVHIYWLLWIVLGFGVMEGWAVWHHRKANTFSNTTWIWLGTFSHPRNRAWRLAIFALFWAGLGLHFAIGIAAWPWLIVPAIPLAVLITLSTFVWKERS